MADKRTFRQEFWSVETIILVVTIVVSTIALIVSVFADLSPLEQCLLAVVAGLAGAQLADNYASARRDVEWHEHNQLQAAMAQAIRDLPAGVLKHSAEIPSFDKYVETAEEFMVIGRTLSRAATKGRTYMKMLRRGCRLRFVLVDPALGHDDGQLEAVLPDARGTLCYEAGLRHFWAEIDLALHRFGELERQAMSDPEAHGSLEVRVVRYVSSLSCVVVRERDGKGKIQLELMPYQCGEYERPFIELSSSDPDPQWYILFKNACDKIWAQAVPAKKPGGADGATSGGEDVPRAAAA
jgi:hypothetical protein